MDEQSEAPKGAAVFKSSIRTMQEDIAALKKGGSPAGFQIEKQSEKDEKTSVQPPILKPTPTFQASSHVELGRLEKSKPLTGGVSLPPPPPSTPSKIAGLQLPGLGSSKPSIGLPAAPSEFFGGFGGLNSRKLIWGGVGLLVIAILVIFFFVLRPSVPEVVFTPTPVPTSTPLLLPGIEGTFSIFSKVNLNAGADVFDSLLVNINKSILAGKEPGLYKIIDPQNGLGYSFNSLMSGALVTVPEEVRLLTSEADFYLSLMQKDDGEYGRAFIVKLNVGIGGGPNEQLSRWETSMASNLKDLFGLDVAKAASSDFLDNTYQGLPIRYMNFPDPLSTVDYGFVTTNAGDVYMIFTNSRAHMYSIIDKLK
jgi:hypothetical protein